MEYLFGFLMSVGIVLALLIWLANKASQIREKNKELMRLYLAKMREVHRLKERTHRFTMPRWPIWPRPVLYEKIDMDTQLTFARVVQQIAVAQSEQCHVQPVTNEQLSVASLHVHVYIWMKYSQNLTRWEHLLNVIQTIEQYLQSIEKNLKKLEEIQRGVKKNLDDLTKDVNENIQKLPNIQKMRNQTEFLIIQKQVENASYFISEAQKSLLYEKSEDGIEYARIHLCCRGAKVMLDSFKAGFIQFSFPANIELDRTSKLTQSLNNFVLHNIPAISSQGWKSLIKINEFLLKAEGLLGQIRESLGDFERKYNNFRERVKSLESINYREQINGAMDAETALSQYWGTMEESPDIWGKILGEKQRPSERLVELQARLQREIGPILRPENIIMQSHMEYILEKLDEAINDFKHLELVVRKIQKHIREQKDAQDQVFKKIGEGGEARIVVNQLTAVRDDTTGDIRNEINAAIASFNKLCERAENPKKADYPRLLIDIAKYVTECRKTKQKHEQEIALLENEATAFSRQIRTLYEKINALGQRRPQVNIDLNNINVKFNNMNSLHKEAGSSYNALGGYIKKSKTTVDDFKRTIQAIEEQFRQYESFKDEIKHAIKLNQDRLFRFMTTIGADWAKPLHRQQRVLLTFSQNLNSLLGDLQKADNISSLDKATEYCEGVRRQLKSCTDSILDGVQKIQGEVNLLLQKDHQLQEMFNHAIDLKLRDLPTARNIREQAKDQNDFETACLFLDRAIHILETGGDMHVNINDIHGSQVNVAHGDIKSHYVSGTQPRGE